MHTLALVDHSNMTFWQDILVFVTGFVFVHEYFCVRERVCAQVSFSVSLIVPVCIVCVIYV